MGQYRQRRGGVSPSSSEPEFKSTGTPGGRYRQHRQEGTSPSPEAHFRRQETPEPELSPVELSSSHESGSYSTTPPSNSSWDSYNPKDTSIERQKQSSIERKEAKKDAIDAMKSYRGVAREMLDAGGIDFETMDHVEAHCKNVYLEAFDLVHRHWIFMGQVENAKCRDRLMEIDDNEGNGTFGRLFKSASARSYHCFIRMSHVRARKRRAAKLENSWAKTQQRRMQAISELAS